MLAASLFRVSRPVLGMETMCGIGELLLCGCCAMKYMSLVRGFAASHFAVHLNACLLLNKGLHACGPDRPSYILGSLLECWNVGFISTCGYRFK